MDKERLEKACQFIEQLPEENFNFGTVREEESCGTVGCFCGWLPEIFPEMFDGLLHKNTDKNLIEDYDRVAAHIFGLTVAQAYWLFTPNSQDILGLTNLGSFATPKEVVAMVREFMNR